MQSYVYALLISSLGNCIADDFDEDIIEGRTKRQINALPLVFPYGATYKLLVGVTTPIPNRDHINFGFLMNFQYQYLQFQNITQLSQYYVVKEVSREEREADWASRNDERLIFYKSVADLLEIKGMNGQDCVHRVICEAAQFPVGEDGLVGEIFQVLLTPDYGRNSFGEDWDWKEDMSSYLDAATAGRQMFDCAYIYRTCPDVTVVLELISTLSNE